MTIMPSGIFITNLGHFVYTYFSEQNDKQCGNTQLCNSKDTYYLYNTN